jgi:hypothetical protein
MHFDADPDEYDTDLLAGADSAEVRGDPTAWEVPPGAAGGRRCLRKLGHGVKSWWWRLTQVMIVHGHEQIVVSGRWGLLRLRFGGLLSTFCAAIMRAFYESNKSKGKGEQFSIDR